MISPGIRDPDGAVALDGAGAGAGSAGRGRGTIAGVLSVTSTGFVGTSASFFTGFAATNASLNIGAGCEPDCMNNTLKRMAIVANAPAAKPATSLGLHPSTRNGWGPRSSWTLFPRPARVVELRTSIHPNAGRQAAAGGHEQPAMPGLTQIEARLTVRAATEVCRPAAAGAGTHVSMQSRNGAARSTFMCTPDAWDAPPPYSLGQWCQRPLKRTLKQEPGRDPRARLRATSTVFRRRIRLEW